MSLAVKRVYEPSSPRDGFRVLVDRLWPRGLTKQDARIDLWAREIAPSTGLRQWYQHDPEKWPEFRRRYFAEIDAHPDLVKELLARARRGRVTLVFGSREAKLNNAVAMQEYLKRRLR
jgi:uncharacterized protein YeaO (DUF488 family)